MKSYFYTSEAVTEGHPDKICDYIADSILDEALRQDVNSKMAVEATIKDDFIFVYGEANTKAVIDYAEIAQNCLKEIGYKEEYKVMVKVGQQSSEINHAVQKEEIAAGDQGIMYGYACDETDVFMPSPIYWAQLLAIQLASVQKSSDFLGPDGKTQVTVEYEDGKVKRIDTIVISTQHTKDITLNQLHDYIMDSVICPIIPSDLIDDKTKFLINPSGSFIVGGSFGDSGITDRKIICDTYGGIGRVGGGCFSSKDPSKVDRTGAYYCRYVAKNIVAHHFAKKCEIQVSYAIGMEEPLSIYVDTFGTGEVSDEEIMTIIKNNFDFRVNHMIEELDLKRPIYRFTTNYGHFGKEGVPWEKVKENLL